jgi:hypothetical protein
MERKEGDNETPKLCTKGTSTGEVLFVCPAAHFTLQLPHTLKLM